MEIDGHDVATTEDHPFWNHTDSEWHRADALGPDDPLLSADGDLLTIDGLDWGSTRTTTAYNLTLDGIHTYYVQAGDEEILVHNTNGCNLWKLTREGAQSTRRHESFGTFYETVGNASVRWTHLGPKSSLGLPHPEPGPLHNTPPSSSAA